MKAVYVGVLLMFLAVTPGFAEQVHLVKSTSKDGKRWRIDIYDYVSEKKPAKIHKRDCFGFIFGPWKKLPLPISVNPSNAAGLTEAAVLASIQRSVAAWNRAAKLEVFAPAVTIDDARDGSAGGNNSISFADFGNNGVLAFTSLWGICNDNGDCEPIAFEIVFNTFYPMGDGPIDGWVYDLDSIMIHEMGHALGLADIFEPACAAVTMYPFMFPGNPEPRTLEWADSRGARDLYRGFKKWGTFETAGTIDP